VRRNILGQLGTVGPPIHIKGILIPLLSCGPSPEWGQVLLRANTAVLPLPLRTWASVAFPPEDAQAAGNPVLFGLSPKARLEAKGLLQHLAYRRIRALCEICGDRFCPGIINVAGTLFCSGELDVSRGR
jgi:hypothetical protein